MSCKVKFGVSFHANMSIEDIVELWCKKVTPEIKAQFPQLDSLMEDAKSALDALRTARTAYKTALEIYKNLQLVLELSTATVAQQGPAYASSIAANQLQKLAMELAQTALGQVQASISAQLSCAPDSNSTSVPTHEETPLDKLIKEAETNASRNLCNDALGLFQ